MELSISLVLCCLSPTFDGDGLAGPLRLYPHVLAYGEPNAFRLPIDGYFLGLIPTTTVCFIAFKLATWLRNLYTLGQERVSPGSRARCAPRRCPDWRLRGSIATG